MSKGRVFHSPFTPRQNPKEIIIKCAVPIRDKRCKSKQIYQQPTKQRKKSAKRHPRGAHLSPDQTQILITYLQSKYRILRGVISTVFQPHQLMFHARNQNSTARFTTAISVPINQPSTDLSLLNDIIFNFASRRYTLQIIQTIVSRRPHTER